MIGLFKQIPFFLLIGLTINLLPLSNANPFRRQAKDFIAELNNGNTDAILFWNSVMLQACANDYDSSIVQASDQSGPTRTSRAFAIIHGAMYESMNIFEKVYLPQFSTSNVPSIDNDSRSPGTEAAIIEAAYQALYALYPKQRPLFDILRGAFRRRIRNNASSKAVINRGTIVGNVIALTMLEDRKSDNSQAETIYTPIMEPGYHRPDPLHPNQGFVTPDWGSVRPFILNSGSQFRASRVVGADLAARRQFLNSTRYRNEYNEVASIGSLTSSVRTADQTEIGIFWGYDGTQRLGVPPRLYNQVVRVVAIQQNNTLQQNARLFSLVNYALADAGIGAWESKYYYNLWRPIIGIRQGTATIQAIPNWQPLGSPADGDGENFTPAFPSYVSGHATFGSATFEMLRLFYGTDKIQFQFQSDEYNGRTVDSITRRVRPARTRHYESFTQAETENLLSRIYLGIHWRVDQVQGRNMGRKIASYIFNKTLSTV